MIRAMTMLLLLTLTMILIVMMMMLSMMILMRLVRVCFPSHAIRAEMLQQCENDDENGAKLLLPCKLLQNATNCVL